MRIAVLGAAACLGCPGSLDDPSRFLIDGGDEGGPLDGATCPDIPNDIFAKICATSGCHSAADKIQGLDLQSPGVAARLVGACALGGGILVDPSNPTGSVLYQKLSATPPYGARMPLGKMPLDDATLACVAAWIQGQTGAVGSCDGGPEGGMGMDAGLDAPAADAAPE